MYSSVIYGLQSVAEKEGVTGLYQVNYLLITIHRNIYG